MQPVVVATRVAGVEAAVQCAVEALRRGELVLVPTDTVYGIAADPRIPEAEQKIYAAKQRDRAKPLPLLAADLDAVEAFGAVFIEEERRLADFFWPGPLTLVLRMKGQPDRLEGFRSPDCPTTLALLAAAGGLLRATSANRSGQPPARTAAEAICALGEFVSVVIDDGPAAGGVPSTVARVSGGAVEVLREGALERAVLQEKIREVVQG
jgi:L-threonylcarbamoyladenylate synthase